MLLFVYGTLKKNFWNNFLLCHSPCLGDFITKEKFCLLINSGLPFVSSTDKVSHIIGEIYDVDNKTLAVIDNLENNGMWYTRRPIEAVSSIDGSVLTAELYFNDNAIGEVVESGLFS
jgi:gamma-glutamylaminecyclotransferase